MRLGLLFVTVAAMLGSAAPVWAQDTVPAPNWTGFYVGANFGGGWDSQDVAFVSNDAASTSIFNAGGKPADASFPLDGVLGGLQFGYNWQFSANWLVGFEADFDWTSMKGSTSSSFAIGGFPLSSDVDQSVQWFGTARARLGYLPMPDLLAFVTGGLAYGRVDHGGTYYNNSSVGVTSTSIGGVSMSCNAMSVCYVGSSSDVVAGWTVGGGLEYAPWRHWTFKIEYLHVVLDSTGLTETATGVFTPGDTPATFNANFGQTGFDVVRVGVNYRF